MDISVYQNKKVEGYFSGIRREVISLIDKGDNRILDMGCGSGNTGHALKTEGYASEVFGIELVPEEAKEAEKKIDKVFRGNIEELPMDFQENYFDYILANDVLEHLHDPWRVIQRLKPILKDEGFFISSIPTVRNFYVLRDLIFRGEWKYVDSGILDKTHLRFFTKKSMIRMFAESGFEMVKIVSNPQLVFLRDDIPSKLTNKIAFKLFKEFLTTQYIMKFKKKRD